MKERIKDFFWPSYVDLMTSLFAVVLVLFVITYVNLRGKIIAQQQQLDLIRRVESNLKLFESDSTVFKYDKTFKRIQLAFDIKFRSGYQFYHISPSDIDGDFKETTMQLDKLGSRIKSIIDLYQKQKENDPAMKDISYLMVISGSASRLSRDDEYKSSILSYNRALFLYRYLKESLNIDFDSDKYHNIIELQISGMGFGGVGRFNYPYNMANFKEEMKNQRFIISIAPKIGLRSK